MDDDGMNGRAEDALLEADQDRRDLEDARVEAHLLGAQEDRDAAPWSDDDPLALDEDLVAELDPGLMDEVGVDALLGRLGRLRAQAARVRDVAARRRAQVEDWEAARLSPLEERERQVRVLLEDWHRRLLESDPSRKTISLPCGELRARARQREWEVTDPVVLGAWLFEHHPDVIVFPPPPAPRIGRDAMKATLTRRDARGRPLAYGVDEDGERPPGLVVHEPETDYGAVVNTEEWT